MTALPLTVEAIDADWLTAALRERHPGIAVTSVVRDAALQGTGTKVRVHVEYDAAGRRAGLPRTLIVKGGFSAHRELMYDVYELEARFYGSLAPTLGMRVPECYYAAFDATVRQGIVILEDLDARGVRFCRVQQPMDFAQARAQLEQLARLHAYAWPGRTNAAPAWARPHDPLPEGTEGAYQRGQLVPEVYAHYMGLPRGVAVSRLFHDRDRMEAAMERLRVIDRESPRCLLHTDPHLGNLYFDADGAAGVLDWQSVRVGPWAHDVCYQLVSSLDIADRPRWEDPLLNAYLEALRRHGVTPPSFDDAFEAYRLHHVYGLYYWLVNPVEFQVEVNNCAIAPRFAAAALDHGTFEALLGTT